MLNQQLQQRIAELESIMQVLPFGVAVAHGPNCDVITGNAALSEMLGMKQGDNLSKTDVELPYEVWHDEKLLQPQEMPIQQAAITGRATGTVEIEIKRRDGTFNHVLVSASPLFDEIGNVRGAVGAFFDMTERRRIDDALRERAELLELASEAIMVRDNSGTIRFWNAGAETLYGWTRAEAIGQNAHLLLSTDLPGGIPEIVKGLACTGRWEGNLKQRTKSGGDVVVASRHAVQVGEDVVLEINRDITAQILAEEALRRNDRLAAMGKLAGIVAHEINNPLAAITNTFYLLKEHPGLDDQARSYARMADQELARVSHITRQTLSFYRESQNAVPVSMSELLDDVLELQHRPMQQAGVTLEKRYSTQGNVNGFPSELKQVLMNLVTNSIQAMPEGGRMRVSIYENSGKNGAAPKVQVFISDTGTGIAPEYSRKLFDPFFTTKSVKGTGLGLWISRGIVQKHDGVLRFRSIFGSSGFVTSFQISIPAHRVK
jgi:PAS domain S-box-containing protein